jgi:hypothetical protein
MADFWQRLAARSLGETPTVQPAIAPLYAPGSLVVQPLDQAEERQDIASSEDQPAMPAPQRVNLPPTSPFVALTRLRIVQEQPQRSIEPLKIEREQPAPRNIDLAAPAPSIAPNPIEPHQTSLPTRSSSVMPASVAPASVIPASVVPIFRAANLASQTNSPTENQISPPSVQPIAKRVETEQPADDRTSDSLPTTPPSDIPSSQSRQNSQPQPIEKAIVQPVLSIAPLIQVAQPQTNQLQIDQLLDQPPNVIDPIAPAARRSSPAAVMPTIQVTIGRIEVRATPPAANRPKPSRSTPQLSLQDYLKQQDLNPGGTR